MGPNALLTYPIIAGHYTIPTGRIQVPNPPKTLLSWNDSNFSCRIKTHDSARMFHVWRKCWHWFLPLITECHNTFISWSGYHLLLRLHVLYSASLPTQIMHTPKLQSWWVLFCLVAPGFSKDIQCHVGPYSFLTFQSTSHKQNGLSAWWLQMTTKVIKYLGAMTTQFIHKKETCHWPQAAIRYAVTLQRSCLGCFIRVDN